MAGWCIDNDDQGAFCWDPFFIDDLCYLLESGGSELKEIYYDLVNVEKIYFISEEVAKKLGRALFKALEDGTVARVITEIKDFALKNDWPECRANIFDEDTVRGMAVTMTRFKGGEHFRYSS